MKSTLPLLSLQIHKHITNSWLVLQGVIMKILIIISFLLSFYSNSSEMESFLEWDRECGEKACMFYYDVFHKSLDSTETITITVAVYAKSKKIAFLSIHYPPQAKAYKHAFFAFIKSDLDSYNLDPIESTMTKVAFESCTEESCVARLWLKEFGSYDLEQSLLTNKYLWFLYQNSAKPIRAIASLQSFHHQTL
jgi:hypothetical protein